jgi:hypothetical protein
MKVVMLVLVGLFIGALVGGVVGVICGFVWINVFNTTSFEGYSGMLVFFTFMPIGMMLGGIGGAIGVGLLAGRKSPA